MKKFLLAVIVACTLILGNNAAIAQNSLMTNSSLIWGSSPFQDSLWSIDTTNWSVVNRIGPTLPGFTITGMNGLAQDPTTGLCYVIMKVSAVSGRVLGIINLTTGVCTQVGNLGDNFSSITFREDGQLFGMTGDGATAPETLWLIDKTTGTKTLAAALGSGADGEVIVFNRSDNFFYHWSGNGTVVYEKVLSVAPYTATNIPIIGATNGETFGAMYLNANKMLTSSISSAFNRFRTTGQVDPSFGSNPDDLRGLIMMPNWQIAGNDTVCQGTSQGITVGGHQLYDSLYFNWGDGNIDSMLVANGTLLTGNHTYASAGTYTVTVKTGNGFGGWTIATVTMVVNPIPVVTLSGFTTICSGDPTNLFASAPSGTYQWYFNGALLPGETTTGISATTATGVYNMIATNTFGCSDSSSAGLNVISSTYPVVDLGADTAVCGPYMLDAGNPGAQFSWSIFTIGQTITVGSSSIYWVDVTNTAGCVTRDSINLIVNSFPVVNVGPDTTVCGSYIADAGPFVNATYMWCDGSTTQTATLTTSGTCMVTVTDANGCATSDTINVVINPNPVVTLGPDVSACTMVVITADSSLIGGTFLWCDSTTGLNDIITNSSTCDLQYTDVNGCMGYDTITITIFGNPTVTSSAAPTTVCADDANVTLTGSPAGGTFTGTSVTGTSFDPSVGAGTYSQIYMFTDANGCSGSDTTSIQVNACVGIQETNLTGFTMFPNPTTGVLNFTLTENSTVEVFDVLGNTIASKEFATGNAQLDLSNQPNGVYFVRVNGTNAQRVVIQK